MSEHTRRKPLFDEPSYLFEQAPQAAGDERQEKLGEVASVLRALETKLADEEAEGNWHDVQHALQAQVEDPETFDRELWEAAVVRFLTEESTRPLGAYCHGGEDLMNDFTESYGIDLRETPLESPVWYITDRAVFTYDTDHCEACEAVRQEMEQAKLRREKE